MIVLAGKYAIAGIPAEVQPGIGVDGQGARGWGIAVGRMFRVNLVGGDRGGVDESGRTWLGFGHCGVAGTWVAEAGRFGGASWVRWSREWVRWLWTR